MGFYREVEVYRIGNKKAGDINRKSYAVGALASRMRDRNTTVDISYLKRNLEEALNAYKNNQPLNFYSDAMDSLAPKLWKVIYERLDNQRFESLLKWYFERIGASNVYIPPKNMRRKEGDADIIASFDHIRVTIYVQAKFHKPDSATDEWAVEQIVAYKDWKEREAGSSDEHTLTCWVVSTCKEFTEECTRMATAHGVVLIDGIKFARMLLEAGIDHLDI